MLPIIIVAGPTASGKSATAVELALHFDSEVISADSMQVFKYFDIGTAKPAMDLRQKVRHHLIDIIEPDTEFTAFDFKTRARDVIRDLSHRNKIPIVVGGTGLYLKALTENYECGVQVSTAIKEQVQMEIREQGAPKIHEALARIDPASAEKIEPTDPIRIERALSVFRESGKILSELHAQDGSSESEFDPYFFFLEKPREQLYTDIDRRVERMMDQGLKKEVASLLDRGYGAELKPFQSIGYSQMVRHLAGEINLERTVYEIKRDTRHYAKRQITWFKKVLNKVSIPATATPTALKDKILSLLPQAVALMLWTIVALTNPESVAARTPPPLQVAAELYQTGKTDAALETLVKLNSIATDADTLKRLHYLLGKVYADKNDFVKATTWFGKAVDEYTEIEDHIRFDLAQILTQSENYEKALEQIDFVTQNFPQTLLQPKIKLLKANILEKTGDAHGAIAILRKLEKDPYFLDRENRDLIPEFIHRQLQLHRSLNQPNQAYEAYQRLYIQFPASGLSRQAGLEMEQEFQSGAVQRRPWTLDEQASRIKQLLKTARYPQAIREIESLRHETKNGRLSSRFYFYLAQGYRGQRDRSQANRVLSDFIKTYPGQRRLAEARFEIGRNLWNLGNPASAIENLRSILKLKTRSKWIATAHFYLGRIYEDEKKTALALQHFETLTDKFTHSKYGEMAAWRMGWIHFRQDRYQEAYDRFKKTTRQFANGNDVDKNLFWMAKAAEALHQPSRALEIFQETFERYPLTYYGLQARYRLGDQQIPLFQREPSMNSIQPAAFHEEQKPEAGLGRPLTAGERFHFMRAQELIKLGLVKMARLELRAVDRTLSKNFSESLWLAYWYNRAGAYSDSLKLLHMFRSFKGSRHEMNLSVDFWRNYYPPAYSNRIENYAQQLQVDPLLVKSIIRQESMYNTWAQSSAGARGLMQIMPKTGERIHSQIGRDIPFDEEALFDPDINIRLGIQYLSNLSRRYQNNGTHILICYNAGPKVLKRWLQRFRNLKDPDIFIESIPYPETRKYVKRVLRNYEIYKALYPVSGTDSEEKKSF